MDQASRGNLKEIDFYCYCYCYYINYDYKLVHCHKNKNKRKRKDVITSNMHYNKHGLQRQSETVESLLMGYNKYGHTWFTNLSKKKKQNEYIFFHKNVYHAREFDIEVITVRLEFQAWAHIELRVKLKQLGQTYVY